MIAIVSQCVVAATNEFRHHGGRRRTTLVTPESALARSDKVVFPSSIRQLDAAVDWMCSNGGGLRLYWWFE